MFFLFFLMMNMMMIKIKRIGEIEQDDKGLDRDSSNLLSQLDCSYRIFMMRLKLL